VTGPRCSLPCGDSRRQLWGIGERQTSGETKRLEKKEKKKKDIKLFKLVLKR